MRFAVGNNMVQNLSLILNVLQSYEHLKIALPDIAFGWKPRALAPHLIPVSLLLIFKSEKIVIGNYSMLGHREPDSIFHTVDLSGREYGTFVENFESSNRR